MNKKIINSIIAIILIITSAFSVFAGVGGGVVAKLEPSEPTDNDPLICYVTGGSGFYNILWYQNGIERSNNNHPVLDASKTNPGDRWKCTAQDIRNAVNYDESNFVEIDGGTGTGGTEGSINVIIQPTTPENDEDLVCYANGGSGFYNFKWYKNDGEISNNNQPILSSTRTNPGERIKCTAQDIRNAANYGSYEVKIGTDDTPAADYNINILPNPADTTDELICVFTGGSGFNTVEWRKDGALQNDLTTPVVPSSRTTRGEMWECTVKDRRIVGLEAKATRIIINSQPTITAPRITPDPATTTQDLTCTAGIINDADSIDTLSITYTWTNGGSVVREVTKSSNQKTDVLSSSNFVKGETVLCQTTPNDGREDGAMQTSNLVTIINTAPVCNNVKQDAFDEDSTAQTITMNCTDVDKADTLSYRALTNPTKGTLSSVSGNTIKYTPNADVYGSDSFTYTANDGNANGNTATISLTINPVNDCPEVNFNWAPNPGIFKQDVEFTSTVTDKENDALTYKWEFGDGKTSTNKNPTNAYNDVKDYKVKLTVSDGKCAVPIEKTISITNNKPNAEFDWTPVNPKIDQEITFNDLSNDPDGHSLTYSWDVDEDGKEDYNTQNPKHTYTLPGDYNVTLTVSDGHMSDSITHTVKVIAELNITGLTCLKNVVENNPQVCSIKVEANGNKIGDANVEVFFEDGTLFSTCKTDKLSGACTTPKVVMDTVGNYTVYAVATKEGYEPDNDKETTFDFQVLQEKYKIVNLESYANDAYALVDRDFFRGEDLYVSFQVVSIYDLSTVITDANLITNTILTSPTGGMVDLTEDLPMIGGRYYYKLTPIPLTHDFLGESDVFTVAINTTDNSGGEGNMTITIRNNPPGITGLPTEFNGSKKAQWSVSLTDYETDLEDAGNGLTWTVTGVDETLFTAEISADDTLTITPKGIIGSDIITLVLSDLDEDTDTQDVTINLVNIAPVANFTFNPTNPEVGNPVIFTDLSTDVDEDELTYEWNFGDGSVNSTEQNPTYTYTANGTYTITLTVSDGVETSSMTQEITVNPPDCTIVPEFSWIPTSPEENENVTFSDESTGTITTYSWNFGDGQTSTVEDPITAYTTAGTYDITLTASNSVCTKSITKSITVVEPVCDIEVGFSFDPTNPIEGDNVDFTDESNGTITTYSWDVDGDNAEDYSTQDATHAYSTANTYSVTLTASNSVCSKSITKEITVECPTINAGFTFDPTNPFEGNNVTFTPNTAGQSNYGWDFGNGQTSNDEISTTSFATAGDYDVELIITNGVCVYTSTETVTVNATVIVLLPPVANAGLDQTVIEGNLVTLDGSTSFDLDGTIEDYAWTVISAPGLVEITGAIGSPEVTFTPNQEGVYVFQLTVTDNDNLTSDPDTVTITVGPKDCTLDVEFIWGPARPTEGQTTQFQSVVTYNCDNNLTYIWNFGDGTTSNQQNPQHVYNKAGSYPITLTVSDGEISASATPKNVNVDSVCDEEDTQDSWLKITGINGIVGGSEVVSSGDLMRIQVKVKNEGGDDDFKDVSIIASMYDLQVRDKVLIRGLNAGESTTRALLLEIPEDAIPGEYPLRLSMKTDTGETRVVHRFITVE